MGNYDRYVDPNYYVKEDGEVAPVPGSEELGLGDVVRGVLRTITGSKKKDKVKDPEFEKKHPRDENGKFAQRPTPSWPVEVEPGVVGEGRKGEDPFVTQWNGKNVLIESTDGSDLVVSYVGLKDLKSTGAVKIPLVAGEKNIWAPELHQVNGKWNIFYTSTGNSDRNEDHRAYVLQGGKSPFGPYEKKIELDTGGNWAIDMTPFKVGKKNYVTWSGWDSAPSGSEVAGTTQNKQHLYVAELKTDKKGNLSTGPRVKIASPSDWEGEILEGPQVLKDPKGNTVLTYSGNKSWTTDYSLGAIKLKGDPLKASSWKKHPKPLAKNVGHGSWVGKKHVFHAKTTEKDGWDDRELRLTDYEWVDGLPVLKVPEKKGA